MKVKNSDSHSIIDQIGICFFDGTYSNKQKKGTVDITFQDYVDSVMNPDDKYIKQVELIRKVKRCKDITEARKLMITKKILNGSNSKDQLYKALKWKSLHVYPSCQFDKEGCKYANVTSVSGLMVYDLQGVDKQVFKQLKAWKHTVCLHKSIGGDEGDYALFLYTPGLTVDSYTGMWEKGNELIQEHFGLEPDNSDEVKDVTRIRYLSYDPDCHYNPLAEPIAITDIIISTTFTEEQKKVINKMLNSEPQWFKFGMALAVSKGEEGRALYHIFSKENKKKYSEDECNSKYDRLLGEAKLKRKDGLTSATLFYMLKEMGVPYALPKSQRNVKDGGGEEITTAMILEFLNANWVRNEINDKVLNYKTGRETNIETVWTEYQLTFDDHKKGINTIHSLVRSERMNTINPVKNFFEEAKRNYDGKKHIDKYVNALPLANREAAELFIKYWLICSYRQAMENETNRTFLIYKGSEEIGKSRALGWLCPLDNYLKTGPLNTDSKDTRIALAHNFVWNDDELKVFRAYDINKIKALISTDVINERTPYARSSETLKRICNFCGSTNYDEILPATEGNTRFLVVELTPNKRIDWQTYMKIDKQQFWGEAIALYEAGWIDKNKVALSTMRSEVNRSVVINTTIHDSIMATLESTVNEKKRTVMSLLEIVEAIDPDNKLNANANQAQVRDIITKEFGNGRFNGLNASSGKRMLGYPVKVIQKDS
jgi:hypothetical protein